MKHNWIRSLSGCLCIFILLVSNPSLTGRAGSPAASTGVGGYQWHTFYGSATNDEGWGIAVDENGGVYITGSSVASWAGPAEQAPLHAFSGPADLFVLKLDAAGAYQWHTFYGINALGTRIALDGSGGVYISGTSRAAWNGPAGQAPLNYFNGSTDIFVLKLQNVTANEKIYLPLLISTGIR